jgi:hypothetical protein
MNRSALIALAIAAVMGSASTSATASGIADLYRRDVSIGSRSVDRYLFNRHFYHRPAVHPALNLDRRDPSGTTAYHAFVRPELERREQALRDQRAVRAAEQRARGAANRAGRMQQGADRFMNTGDRFNSR